MASKLTPPAALTVDGPDARPAGALPLDDARRAAAAPAPDWQHVWFALERTPWSSLVLVPSQPDVAIMPIARSLLAVGEAYDRLPLRLIDAERADPRSATVLAQALRERVPGARRVVAVSSPLANPAVIPIIRAADAAVLVVELGRSGLRAARRALAAVGRERFVGSITVRPRR
jgi:hypothetical protein